MAHARFTAGNMVGLEQPHLRPAQTEAIADRIIDFLGACHTVVNQMQAFPPHRFQQAIGDEGRFPCGQPMISSPAIIDSARALNGCITVFHRRTVQPKATNKQG